MLTGERREGSQRGDVTLEMLTRNQENRLQITSRYLYVCTVYIQVLFYI